MAIVNGSVIGNLSGKLGNLSARTKNGQTIMSARPSSFDISYSPESVAARQKFGVTGSFAKAVLNSPDLNEIWSKIKGQDISTFNTIFKINYPYSSSARPTLNNIITPDGFRTPVTSASTNGQKLTVVMVPLNSYNLFSEEETTLAVSSLVVLHTLHTEVNNELPFRIINLQKEYASFNYHESFTAELPLDVSQAAMLNNYQKYIFLVACISKTAAGKIVQHSVTYSAET